MNDLARGAFEALSWVESLIDDCQDQPDGWKKLITEINEAINSIKRGVSIDFMDRLRIASR